MIREFFSASEVHPLDSALLIDLTPEDCFYQLTHGGESESFLFERRGGAHAGKHLSCIGIHPKEVLLIENGIFKIRTRTHEVRIEEGNPFEKLGAYLQEQHQVDSRMRSAGAFGYIGYEAVQYLESIDPAQGEGVPRYDAYVMIFDALIVYHHDLRQYRILSQDPEEIIRIKKLLATPIENREPHLFSRSNCERDSQELQPLLGEKRFLEAVQRIQGHIQKGDVFQCVISEQFTAELKVSPFEVYRALRQISPTSYLFYFKMKEDVLLGASPEMLLMANGKTIETNPIAGTRPRGKTQSEDLNLEIELSQNEKEKAEHLMLVDLGRNDLGRVSLPGTVHVPKFMKVQRYSHVMHLVSSVIGELDHNRTAWDAFAACFPAGTLTGAPKIRAMQLISEIELRCRGSYGGAILFDDFCGNFDSCIVIRSLYCREGKAYLQAGAGIVADSSPEEEYQEVLRKIQSVRMALALAHQEGGGR